MRYSVLLYASALRKGLCSDRGKEKSFEKSKKVLDFQDGTRYNIKVTAVEGNR